MSRPCEICGSSLGKGHRCYDCLAYCYGKSDGIRQERNRIADAAESLAKHGEAIADSVARVGFTDAASAAYYAETLAVVRAYTSFAERLRKGEV